MFVMDSLIFLPMKMLDRVSKHSLTGLRILSTDFVLIRFPQLYVDGEFIGGLDIVKEMVTNGEFEEIMQGHLAVASA